ISLSAACRRRGKTLSLHPRKAGVFGRVRLCLGGTTPPGRRPVDSLTDEPLTVQMQQTANRQPSRPKSRDAAVLTAVERALAELRRGAGVVLYDWSGHGAVVQAAEQASPDGLAALTRLTGTEPLLLLTARRAQGLGPRCAEAVIPSRGAMAPAAASSD